MAKDAAIGVWEAEFVPCAIDYDGRRVCVGCPTAGRSIVTGSRSPGHSQHRSRC
jgi:hypothetical protein